MPLVSTDAIILHAFDYLESSRILRMLTRDAGVRSVVAKGLRKSARRFGGGVDLFARGTAHLYTKPGRDLDTLAGFDDLRVRMSLERWAEAWEREARTLFLNAYVRTAQGSPVVPADPDVLARALAVFELEKAVYELGYEMNNRPDWLWVPLEGIRAILGGRA